MRCGRRRGGDPLATEVGAANTLRRRGGVWEAANTDVDGFLAPLSQARTADRCDGARATVLGGGGSARRRRPRAALEGRARSRCSARRAEQAREVAEALGAQTAAWPPAPKSWDLLVNCTPLGGAHLRAESPLPGGPFDGRLVYDLTYGPASRRSCVRRAPRGAPRSTALSMLVAQAERQFAWWTGRPADAGVMDAAARAAVAPQRVDTGAVVSGAGAPRPGTNAGRGRTRHAYSDVRGIHRSRAAQHLRARLQEVVADLLTPVSAFLKFAEQSDYSFLFESVEGGEQVARYSFLGKDPFLILRARDGKVLMERAGQETEADRGVRADAA